MQTFEPFRDRTMTLMSDPGALSSILDHGAERAAVVADHTLRSVYERIGFVPGRR